MMNFENDYFQKLKFTENQTKEYFISAKRKLEIAQESNIPEVIFTFSYDALIKLGIALISEKGYKVRSIRGHHIKILEKTSQLLKNKDINTIGNEMRQKRNTDLYGGGVLISEKDSKAYTKFIQNIFHKALRDKNIDTSQQNPKNTYLIIDLEATCWENHGNRDNMEIIEIGAVLVDNDYRIIGEYQTFIKPIKNSKLSEFCKNLTSIKQENIDDAEIFPVALEKFIQWVEIKSKDNIENIIFCSWGYYDKKQLTKDCELHNIIYPFQTHHSIKHEFAEMKNLRNPIGMEKALQMCKISLDGTHHRGIDDAKNIAKIFIQEKIL